MIEREQIKKDIKMLLKLQDILSSKPKSQIMHDMRQAIGDSISALEYYTQVKEKEEVYNNDPVREKTSEEQNRKYAMEAQESSNRNNTELFQKVQMEYEQRSRRRGR